MRKTGGAILFLLLFPLLGLAQQLDLYGNVSLKNGKPLKKVEVGLFGTSHSDHTDEQGNYRIEGLEPGKYEVRVFALGFKTDKRKIHLDSSDLQMNFQLDTLREKLKGVEVVEKRHEKELGLARLNSVEGTSIYAGKKTEVVDVENVQGDRSTNQAREIFGKVAGIVSYEDGDAGIQMDVGTRGLNPSRSANFNVRQNGYDISADALGYPEAYYTPPTQAVKRIEVVRGAASLQYGPQFGGLINFVFHEPPETKPLRIASEQTVGSFGMFNSFTSVGFRKGQVGAYGFYHRRKGEGWRPNSEYEQESAYTNLTWNPTPKTKIEVQYTHMNSLQQKPGGLTDRMFEEDPSQSVRERNWFQVKWNLGAIKASHKLSEKTEVSTRFFGLKGSRDAVGFLGPINRVDPGKKRTLLKDEYNNFGNETRLITRYNLGSVNSTFLIGGRYYQGRTERTQGKASAGYKPDFSLENPEDPSHSDHLFPSRNLAFFAENLFQVGEEWSITPGVRYERINTGFEGYYNLRNTDLAGNVIYEDQVWEEERNQRDFFLYGLGVSYKPSEDREIYGNFSTNYRGIGFNDLRLAAPNFRVDPDLKDETGYTADLGAKLSEAGFFDVNVSVFLLYYSDRIGAVLKKDEQTYRTYRLRTNISDSRTTGIESFMELDLIDLLEVDADFTLSLFSNITLQKAVYVNSEEAAFEGNKVEMAPDWIIRSGISLKKERFRAQLQGQYVSHQYSDATNAEYVPSAIHGGIPAYTVMDFSASYNVHPFQISAGIHNLFNNSYFTRRASGYSGPGIVPAPPRNFYLGVRIEI